jgi:SAM-dependent methyltransferase
MSCPLCAYDRARSSWLGSTFYHGKEFPYLECRSCGSLYCDPMPDNETLSQMYGEQYATSFTHDPAVDDPKEPLRTLEWLKRLGGGTFLDYGCGAGSLLVDAARLNWRAIGVEFDAQVAREVQKKTGARVVSDPSVLLDANGPPADVLHLGDVVEHLTALDRQMPQILRLIKPGGLLLAQGPLEANPTLFALALRLGRAAAVSRRTEMAPYHVLLATATGQRQLFRRFGVAEREYSVREVSWPAPSRLAASTLSSPRSLALYALRRLSQTVSSVRPGAWGNRYFYAGQWNG